MKKRNVFFTGAALAALMFGLVFVGCSSPSNSDGDDGHTGPVQIGIAMPNDSQRWLTDGNSLLNLAKGMGYQADVWFSSDQSIQDTQVRNLLGRGAGILIIGCIDTSASAAIVDEAVGRGVKVIAFDRLIFGTTEDYDYITFNNYKVGQIQGQAIETALGLPAYSGPAKNIVIFSGALYDGNAKFFHKGAMDVLQTYITSSKLSVVDSKTTLEDTATVNWGTEGQAGTRMHGILTTYSTETLDAVLAANDYLARDIIAALRTKTAYDQNPFPVVVTGQDAEWDSYQSILNDEQYMTVYKNTWKMAKVAVALADHLYTGAVGPIDFDGITVKLPSALSSDEKEMGNTNPGGTARYVDTYLLEPVYIDKANANFLITDGWF
jgi:putative multiple sugar transport system substrate-binding protein